MLKDIPFFEKDHEGVYTHIDKVLDIADYFNIPNVTKDVTILPFLPVTLKDAVKNWLKSLPHGAITTWAKPKNIIYPAI